MDPDTVKKLVNLNQRFYQTFAVPFSATRRRLQPGVKRLLESFPPGSRLLDLGCGNGELGRELARRGWPGNYTGVDFAPELIQAEEPAVNWQVDKRAGQFDMHWLQADLTTPHWGDNMPGAQFDIATAFAVLHHIPGKAARLNLLHQTRRLLIPGGICHLSNWQFLNSPRLQARIQPWSAAGIDPASLEPGDYLLDWRSGGSGLRYVHHFTPKELADLAVECGFWVIQTFMSDGRSGDLSIYQTWQAEA